jgi:short-chain fatty acids transporter
VIRKITDALVRFLKEYLPSSYWLALILAVVVFVSGLVFTKTSVSGMVGYIGKGMFDLLAFTMQMVLILVTGYALANAPIVLKVLKNLAKIPKTNTQAIMFTSFIASVCTYIHWGFGLVAGALIAKEVAILNYGKKIHYPLLIAAAYSGNLLRGPSSTVFLGPTDPKHVAAKYVGVIPLGDTLYGIENIIMTLVLLFGIPLLYKYMIPSEDKSVEIKLELIQQETAKAEKKPVDLKSLSFADRMEENWLIQYIVAGLLATYIVADFIKSPTLNLSINMIILIFLVLGMFAHKTPGAYAKAVKDATKTTDGMILQFPFYAAIMVMLRDTGMSTAIANWFISISTANTLPLFAFYAAGLVNLFIPSGGGLWAIQGPIMLEAAKILGADPAAVIVGMGWGDSWTSQVQPFWALPLLAIAGLDVNDIMGYCAMVLVFSGIVISATLLLM